MQYCCIVVRKHENLPRQPKHIWILLLTHKPDDVQPLETEVSNTDRARKIIGNLSRKQTKHLESSVVEATYSMIFSLRRLQSVSDNWEFGVREVITRVFVICIDISVIYEAPVGIVLFTRNHTQCEPNHPINNQYKLQSYHFIITHIMTQR